MPYVYSTATCSGTYVKYQDVPANSDNKSSPGHNKVVKSVTIQGGNGVATRHLITPKGMVTKVSDEDLAFLMQNRSFQRHMDAGFITVDKKKVDPAIKAKDMTEKDGSAPLTPKDFEKGEQSDENTKVYKGVPKSKR